MLKIFSYDFTSSSQSFGVCTSIILIAQKRTARLRAGKRCGWVCRAWAGSSVPCGPTVTGNHTAFGYLAGPVRLPVKGGSRGSHVCGLLALLHRKGWQVLLTRPTHPSPPSSCFLIAVLFWSPFTKPCLKRWYSLEFSDCLASGSRVHSPLGLGLQNSRTPEPWESQAPESKRQRGLADGTREPAALGVKFLLDSSPM